MTGTPQEVAPGVFRIEDTCAVYLVLAPDVGGPRTAVAVDFGSGRVLDVLADLGVERITDVLMTHHHRDQGQGLPRAVAHGARIHVPPVEVDLFARPEEVWAQHRLDNDYTVRQDRFSLLAAVPVASTVPEYRTVDHGGVRLRVLPTPGHTVGSVSYLLETAGRRIVFSGDLIHSAGKVWSMAATQWTYTGHEGPAMVVLSCLLLAEERPDLLLPSHGGPITEPLPALDLLARRMQEHVDGRRQRPWDLADWLRRPYVRRSEHLLMNRTSVSYSYVLLSDTGEALVVDYGYDVTTGLPLGGDRSSQRPWLASLPALKKDFGVRRISVALPTHYHDDHVAGMPLLRAVEGTEIWAPSTVAPVLADPWRHDLPCQWFEPITSDRVLPVGESFDWNEYRITVHDQPGHTLFQVAYQVVVDGVTVLFTGDQQENAGVPGGRPEIFNYQYRNRFRLGDYPASARMYRQVAPGLLLGGHWAPRPVEDGYLDYLLDSADRLDAAHRTLLPDELDLGADGVLARLEPYRSAVPAGSRVRLTATVRNPHPVPADAVLVPVLPAGWSAAQPRITVPLQAGEQRSVPVDLVAVTAPAGRARLALDVGIGPLLLGQHAEAVVDLT